MKTNILTLFSRSPLALWSISFGIQIMLGGDERRILVLFPAEVDIYLPFSTILSIAPQIYLSSIKLG